MKNPKRKKDITHLNGEPLPSPQARRLSREEELALGIPSPEELAEKQPATKITLAVDDEALAWFRAEGERLGTPYQRMLRNLISAYARRHRATAS